MVDLTSFLIFFLAAAIIFVCVYMWDSFRWNATYKHFEERIHGPIFIENSSVENEYGQNRLARVSTF
jgi:hypothetical protein